MEFDKMSLGHLSRGLFLCLWLFSQEMIINLDFHIQFCFHFDGFKGKIRTVINKELSRSYLQHGVHIVRICQDFWKYCKMSVKTSGFRDFSSKCQDLSGFLTFYSSQLIT